jgi:hypothetical protein
MPELIEESTVDGVKYGGLWVFSWIISGGFAIWRNSGMRFKIKKRGGGEGGIIKRCRIAARLPYRTVQCTIHGRYTIYVFLCIYTNQILFTTFNFVYSMNVICSEKWRKIKWKKYYTWRSLSTSMYECFILSIINSKKLHISLFKESTYRIFGTFPKLEHITK